MTLDKVKRWILERIETHGPEFSFAPGQIAEAFLAQCGVMGINMLPEALLHLIWEGKLVVTGPWRVRLPRPDEVKVKPPELVRLEAAREGVLSEARALRVVFRDDTYGYTDVAKLAASVDELLVAEEAMKP